MDTVFVVLSPPDGAQTDDHYMLKILVIIKMHSPINQTAVHSEHTGTLDLFLADEITSRQCSPISIGCS